MATATAVRDRTWRVPPTLALTFTVPSKTNPFNTHQVRRDFAGDWTCTCVGYGYRRSCSHIKYSQALVDEFEATGR